MTDVGGEGLDMQFVDAVVTMITLESMISSKESEDWIELGEMKEMWKSTI